jgi:hypothetical protein
MWCMRVICYFELFPSNSGTSIVVFEKTVTKFNSVSSMYGVDDSNIAEAGHVGIRSGFAQTDPERACTGEPWC